VTFVADRPGHDFRYAIDTAATRAALGWAPTRSLDVELPALVRWYAGHAAWRSMVLERARYACERLGGAA
jgi:dTDP-glucose 4,6-dehydratase